MAAKKSVKKAEVCSTDCKCGGKCRMCGFILPLVIIILLWMWPAVLWSKIAITVLAAIGALAHTCKCN